MHRAIIVAAVVASALSSTLAVASSLTSTKALSAASSEAVWKSAPVRGSCSTAKTMVELYDDEEDGDPFEKGGDPAFVVGDVGAYTSVVCVDANRAGSVYVRADPEFFGDDHDNVVGTLASGICVRAQGPLKRQGGPLAWAVPVDDDEGNSCRGYVSDSVVKSSW